MAARERVQTALLLLILLPRFQGRLPWPCWDSRSRAPCLGQLRDPHSPPWAGTGLQTQCGK